MTTDLELRQPQAVTLTSDQLSYIAGTEFVPPGLRHNLPAILACVAMGRELGIGDMTALNSIHIIDGKASMSAQLMLLLVRRQGHSIQGSVTPDEATVVGRRVDNDDTMTVTWTKAMAEQAGLMNKSVWIKYPQSMLWARAASQLCRMLFPDCFAGATYTPEELGDDSGSGVGATVGFQAGDATPDSVLAGGPSGEHSGAAEGPPSAPSLAQDSGESPASPANKIRAATDGLPAVDMADPDIPFGDSPPPQPRYITERQRTRLFTIATKAKVDEDEVRALVLEFTGQESTKLIPAGNVYDGIVAAVQAKGEA